MAAEKPGFVLYLNQKNIIDELTDEEVGILIKALFEYELTKKIPKLEKMLKIIFLQFKNMLDNDEKKYKEKCLKNQQNIKGYWEKVKQKNNDTNEYDRIRTNTMATNKNKNMNKNMNMNKNININKKNKREREKEREKRNGMPAAAPTLANICSYSRELGLNDKNYCEKFFNHYESIGWVNGTGQEIKNWKLVFNNWLKKDNKISKEDSDVECSLQ